ncbi:unnamed protein product [Rotaria socialis]|uniref:Uncharacterized protein n=1 Tax=Rotaria socialis TaxID=392032 RepID=A0A820YL50_9BILA|nr:unnamed protein product [Rotaria socialis]CAF3362325.1 unnamed protein product [Rotaria socialis]CAF3526166.1 unnamed protein product [Rotaria socialis]CAF3693409.1 unnamed protein product [Rotaria socialis]CAF4283188.1 unnamed protein product [Rotaria socialis]
MDSKGDQHLSDPQKLEAYLQERIQQIEETLDDDENFCNREIDATNKYIEKTEKKFHEKIHELKAKLEDIRVKNKKTSEENKAQFNNDITEVIDLFRANNYDQARKKFEDCEKRFEQRTTCIQQVPKLRMKESDIDELFTTSECKINKPAVQPIPVAALVLQRSTINDNDYDDESNGKDQSQINRKQKLRQEKIIESVNMNRNDEETEEDKKDLTGKDSDLSTFGIQSKRAAAQSTTEHTNTTTNVNQAPVTTTERGPRFRFSTRLNPPSTNSNISFSGRRIPSSSSMPNSNVNSYNTREQIRATVAPPTTTQQQTTLVANNIGQRLPLTPVSHYRHEPNMLVLLTCNAKYIVLYKGLLNRVDNWHLGVVERGVQKEYPLNWHDGLIISMGWIINDDIYMFTEREFFIYSIGLRIKLNSRMLPRSDDDEPETNYSHRGIGAVYDKYIYHIYTNRSCHWTLTHYSREKFVSLNDYDLTMLFPDVERFIHFCVNDKTMNFLVQMNDASYGVVFCWTNNFKTNEKMPAIRFPIARNPLTICSAFIQCLNQYIIFVNDPSINILHILSTEKYLQAYREECHAMCHVAVKNEIILLTNNSISSINLNQSNSFFSQFSPRYTSDI